MWFGQEHRIFLVVIFNNLLVKTELEISRGVAFTIPVLAMLALVFDFLSPLHLSFQIGLE
jgi:hypothetical protein